MLVSVSVLVSIKAHNQTEPCSPLPDIMLFRRSKCINDVRFPIDLGIDPVILLSARFKTVS
ncbi:hypothetical protein Hanom_Chr01g00071391 [Helianthus anomalus]